MSIGNIVVPNPAKWWEFASYLKDKKINMSNGNITVPNPAKGREICLFKIAIEASNMSIVGNNYVPNPAKSGNKLFNDNLILVKLFVNLLFNFVFDSLLSWTPALHWVEIIS